MVKGWLSMSVVITVVVSRGVSAKEGDVTIVGLFLGLSTLSFFSSGILCLCSCPPIYPILYLYNSVFLCMFFLASSSFVPSVFSLPLVVLLVLAFIYGKRQSFGCILRATINCLLVSFCTVPTGFGRMCKYILFFLFVIVLIAFLIDLKFFFI